MNEILTIEHDKHEHYIALILTLLGIVQGLAFGHLAERMPQIDKKDRWLDKFLMAVNFSFAY